MHLLSLQILSSMNDFPIPRSRRMVIVLRRVFTHFEEYGKTDRPKINNTLGKKFMLKQAQLIKDIWNLGSIDVSFCYDSTEVRTQYISF